MVAQIDRNTLRQGACYALTHAMQLLEDSAFLYSSRRTSSSFHLAVMAREELGRFVLLLKLQAALTGHETIEVKKFEKSFKLHLEKLAAGQSVIGPIPMSPQTQDVWANAVKKHRDPAKKPKASDTIFGDADDRKDEMRKIYAIGLHDLRLKAQYVDLDTDSGTWSRPSEVTMADTLVLIRVVMTEIANALIGSHSIEWLHVAYSTSGEQRPHMGSFTHRVSAHLTEGEALARSSADEPGTIT